MIQDSPGIVQEQPQPAEEIRATLQAANEGRIECKRRLARAAAAARERRLFEAWGYATWQDFVREELQMARSSINAAILVERRLLERPVVERALETGAISYKAAEVILRGIYSVEELCRDEAEDSGLRLAAEGTIRDLEDWAHVNSREDAEWKRVSFKVPPELYESVWEPWVEMASRLEGRELDAWEALEIAIAMATQEAREMHEEGIPDNPDSRFIRMIFARDNWGCMWPGCSKKGNLECHEILPRGRGGKREWENCVTLCAMHHRRITDEELKIFPDGDALVFEADTRLCVEIKWPPPQEEEA